MINKRTERCNRNNGPVYCIQKIKCALIRFFFFLHFFQRMGNDICPVSKRVKSTIVGTFESGIRTEDELTVIKILQDL